ncbi:MAG TPA: histone deacetylase [Solirubrobacteraceae bacterium]
MRAGGLLFEHRSSREHDPRAGLVDHPDSPDRIEAIDAALAPIDWLGFGRREAPAATRAELEGVHDRALIDRIERLCGDGGGQIDEDTFVGEASYRAALHAAGGACAMVRSLAARDAATAFALLRPAGHHAERSRAMGFCLFNNVAVAAQLARAELGVRRVFILDWDVHHGNGTAEIFRYRDDVLYASIHQAGLYPGTGRLSDAGSGAGLGYTLNLPVSAGSEGDVWLSLLEHVVLPAAVRFAPELVLISAGFDAHRADPLGGCRLDAADFAQMTAQVLELAGRFDAPIGAVLEGGCDPPALADCVIATLEALSGQGDVASIAPDVIFTPRAASYVGQYWEL